MVLYTFVFGLSGSNGFVMYGVTTDAEFGSFVSDACDIDGGLNYRCAVFLYMWW